MEKHIFESKSQFVLAVAEELQPIGGVSFVGIRHYLSDTGELSNYLINLGVKPETIKARNLDFFNTHSPEDIITGEVLLKYNITVEDVRRAFAELRQSIISPNKRRSQGQINNYEYISHGLKYNSNTLDFYVTGLRMHKKVLVPAVTEIELGKRPLTRAKNFIRWNYLKKIRVFKLKEGSSIVLNGKEFQYLRNPELEDISAVSVDDYVDVYKIQEELEKKSNL